MQIIIYFQYFYFSVIYMHSIYFLQNENISSLKTFDTKTTYIKCYNLFSIFRYMKTLNLYELSTEIATLEAFTIGWFSQLNFHAIHVLWCEPHSIWIIAMCQRYDSLTQETLSTTITLFQKPRRGYHGGLNLTVARTLTLIHSYFSITGSL